MDSLSRPIANLLKCFRFIMFSSDLENPVSEDIENTGYLSEKSYFGAEYSASKKELETVR